MCSPKAMVPVKIITRQKESLLAIPPDALEARLPIWRDRTIRFLRAHVVSEELELLAGIDCESYATDQQEYVQHLTELEEGIREFPEQYLVSDPLPDKNESPAMPDGTPTPSSNRVFVVHGHDSQAQAEVARTLEKLGLQAIILHEQPNEGRTIIEKFERDASQVTFAVILLTPDDIGYPKNKENEKRFRARQNVVLELGYFSGILGRQNVCVLHKGDVEIPSDFLGVVYVAIDDAGAWKFSLAKEFRQSGLPVDLNNLA